MKNIREGLGAYLDADGKNARCGLTLHDTGELIRRAGMQAGFIVKSEHRVNFDDRTHPLKIDWVWICSSSRKVKAAFEIEGRNVPRKSIDNDFEKFFECNCINNFIVLYHVNNNHEYKNKPRLDDQRRVQSAIEAAKSLAPKKYPKMDVTFIDDHSLFADKGGIEKILELVMTNA